MVLVDTHVMLDVAEDDALSADGSQGQLERPAVSEMLAINPVICSELSITHTRSEEMETIPEAIALPVIQIPRRALFPGGKPFLGVGRYRGCFPTLAFIAPELC